MRTAQEIWDSLAGRPDLAHTLGIRLVGEDQDGVIFALPWSPAVSQPSGVFAAGGLFALADIASTVAAMRARPQGFMLAIDSAVHLLSNSGSGGGDCPRAALA